MKRGDAPLWRVILKEISKNSVKETLTKDIETIDKILETGDTSLFNKQYWDRLVDEFDDPDTITKHIEDGLSKDEIKFLKDFS